MKTTEVKIIDTTEQVKSLVGRLELPVQHVPTMFVDLEGVDLGREGSVSIFTLSIDTGEPTMQVYLIDIHTLGNKAFETADSRGVTFKNILQDEKIIKVFFDVRNDSDALFRHFNVALQGVEDVQLMESATRKTSASRRLLNGLKTCIEKNVLVSLDKKTSAGWKQTKEKGKQLFETEDGGAEGIFNQRPICAGIISYCVGDVQYLPELRRRFFLPTIRWQDLVTEEIKKRVAASQDPRHQPRGPDKAIAPWSREQNALLDQWNHVPSHDEDLDDSLDYSDDNCDDDWYDDGPTSCRDVIDDCDYHFYYND
jgi:exonuclease 3'-5' domain-containing protein 1